MLRLLGWLFGFGVFCALGGIGGRRRLSGAGLGRAARLHVLKDYQPPVTTRVHAADGTLLAEYARERRLFQPIETIPPLLIARLPVGRGQGLLQPRRHRLRRRRPRPARQRHRQASTATTDPGRRLDHHPAGGQELPAQLRADLGPQDPGSDPGAPDRRRPFPRTRSSSSTSTRSFLGLNSYGVAAAALNYFDKALYQLDSERDAPISRRCPRGRTTTTRSDTRRRPSSGATGCSIAWPRMATSPPTERDAAKAEALNVVPRASGSQLYSAEYFTEEVRRQLLAKSTARTSSMAAGCRCAPRSSPSCRNMRARR